MYCPNCKAEFREGFTYCSKCECSLVELMPKEEGEEAASANNEREVFLVNVRNENEADIIESFLNTQNIKTTRRYREAGDYLSLYMGNTVLGCDVYVLESDYEAAKELIESEPEDAGEEDAIFEQDSMRRNKIRSAKAWIILLFFSGILFAVIYLVKALIDMIFN